MIDKIKRLSKLYGLDSGKVITGYESMLKDQRLIDEFEDDDEAIQKYAYHVAMSIVRCHIPLFEIICDNCKHNHVVINETELHCMDCEYTLPYSDKFFHKSNFAEILADVDVIKMSEIIELINDTLEE